MARLLPGHSMENAQRSGFSKHALRIRIKIMIKIRIKIRRGKTGG
jgi:hypothetical protein